MRRVAWLSSLIFVAFFMTGVLAAQVPDPSIAAQAPVPGAGHNYIGMGAETVNPADGSLSFDLPFDPPAGRGPSMKFGIRFAGTEQFYLTNRWTQNGNLQWTPNWVFGQAPWQVGAWSYDLPILTTLTSVFTQGYTFSSTGCGNAKSFTVPNGWMCQFICYGADSFIFRGLDGNQTLLPIASVYSDPNNIVQTCPTPTNFDSPANLHGVLSTLSTSGAVTVVDPSGTTYQFSGSGAPEPQAPQYDPIPNGSLPASITDRNGNQIIASGLGYKDSTGRTVVSWTGIGNNGDQVTIAGLGAPVTIKWTTTPVSFPESGKNIGNGNLCSLVGGSVNSVSVISEIDLPNGQKYTFQYDGTYGMVSKVTFPDGGYVRYVWGLNQDAQSLNASWTVPTTPPQPGGCTILFDIPAITDRYVSYDGVNEVLHQQFSYSTTWNASQWTSKQTIMTATDLLTGQSTNTTYTYGGVAPDKPVFTAPAYASSIPVESSVVYRDGSGKTLKTVNKAWLDTHSILGDQTILYDSSGNPSVGNGTLLCYDANEQLTNTYEYGFQTEGSYPAKPSCALFTLNASYAGPLRRQTTTAYHPYFSWNGNTSPATWSGTHIVSAPDSVTVADGSGNTVKQTLYTYDQNPLQPSGAINLSNPSTARANITTLQRLISGSTYVKTTYNYYDTGQLYQMTDACGNTACSDMTGANHTTTYSYSDNYATGTGTPPGQTFAYLTSVTYPNTGVAHTESFSWGYTDGQIRSHTDQNSQTTSFLYNDPGFLNRLTEIDYPDGGKTTVTYNDSTYSSVNNTPNFAVTKLITGTVNIGTTTAFDGLGHTVRTLLTSDPEGTDITDIGLDGFGRTRTKSNPHRSSSSPTDGITTTTYDAIGRAVSVAETDGSTVTTSYSGPCTTVTDEAGNARESCVDGLGRLAQVNEPGVGVTSATPGAGTVTISGSEQSSSAKAGSGSINISAGSASCQPVGPVGTNFAPQNGTIFVTINGAQASFNWGGNCSSTTETLQPPISTVAASLASAITASAAGVTATASGATITLQAKTTGSNTNYPISITETWGLSTGTFGQGYTACCNGSLSGGSNGGTDSGTVSINVNGYVAAQSYGASDTAQTIASGLTSTLNLSSSPVNASLSGTTISLTSKVTGAASDYSLSASSTWNTQLFSSPSFSGSPSGSTLTGGADGNPLGTTPLVTQYNYDTSGNLLCAWQKATDATSLTFSYNPSTNTSNCLSASANWRPRAFFYDALARLLSATNPESGTITYAYDANSNVSTKTSPKPNPGNTGTISINYSYDALNRLLNKTYVGGITTTAAKYSYDGTTLSCPGPGPLTITGASNRIGRRSAMCSTSSASSWSYDPMGRPLVEKTNNVGNIGKTVSYSYNLDGSLKTLTYPSGDLVTYTPTGAGRMSNLSDSANNYVAPASTTPMYAPPGELLNMKNGTAITTQNAYTSRLQPATLSAETAAATFMSLSYDFHSGHGDNGNVFQVINNLDSTRSAAFQYDPLNRITQANTVTTTGANCWGEVYTIDNWGNLTNRSGPAGMGSCSTELLSASASTKNQLSGLTYDLAGNVTNDGNGNSPTYDSEYRMVTDAGVTYSYDAHGNRMEKSSGTFYWYGPGGEILAESNLSGTINEEYIFFNGTRLARVDRPSNTVHYYFSDHLGSATVITDAVGNVGEQYFYYPYGGLVAQVGSDTNHYKFTDKERDSESGLDNFVKRYHASSLGRFMTPDPIGIMKQKLIDPQQWNMYAYARNNPVRFVDPKGMYNTDCTGSDITKCSANIQNFETNRQKDLQSKDPAVRAAAAAFGSFNDKNKVDLKFDANATNGKTQQEVKDGKATDRVSVTMPTMGNGVNLPDAGLLAHEGTHVQDVQSSIAGHPVTHFVSEMKAYMADAAILEDFFPVGVPVFSQFVHNGASMTLMAPTDSAASEVDEDAIRQYLATNPEYRLFPGPVGNEGGPVGLPPQ